MRSAKAIVLFDGVCTLCNESVDRIIRYDRKDRIRVGALQDLSSKAILSEKGMNPEYFDSLVLLENDTLYLKSTAALRIARLLSGAWPLLYVLILIPACLRDPVYDWVGRNRYRWFGKKNTCRLPTPEERRKFLSDHPLKKTE